MRRGLSLVVLSLGLSGAAAASTFTAGVGCNGPFEEIPGPGPDPVANFCSERFTEPAFSPLGSGAAFVDAGVLVGPQHMRMFTSADLDVTGAESGNRTVGGQAYGIWEFDDFLVTGTGPGPISVLAGALHLSVAGVMFGNGSGDSQGPLTASFNGRGQFYFEIELNGTPAGYGQALYNSNNGNVVEAADGLMIGHYGGGGFVSASITSSQLMIPVGQTFSVRVYANASARGSVTISGTPADEFDTVSANASGRSDFDQTVSFPMSGPVFDLPAGFTLNSASAGIVNNQFVPEPAGRLAMMIAAGALGLLAARRRS